MQQMSRSMTRLKALTIASLKMYVRNTTGLFFTMFIPIILIVVFGFLFQNNNFKTDIALTNYSQTELSKQLVDSLKKVEAFRIEETDEGTAADKLGRGKIDLEIIIPETFGQSLPEGKGLQPVAVQTYYNESNPRNGQTTNLIVGQIISGFNAGVTKSPQVYTVKPVGVKTNNLGQIDFFLPGVIAMSIMQLGIFSVAFVFVTYKTTGQLRRIQATPTHPIYFVIGQAITREIVAIVQVGLLLGLGMWAFHAKMIGSILSFMIMAALGAAAFLAIGFAIAGWARDENQATPLAQLVQFPMLFLSGVFFPRDGLPAWLAKITDYLPLTYLVDGLRKIATEGATLMTVWHDVVGLLVWMIVVFIISIFIFRWE